MTEKSTDALKSQRREHFFHDIVKTRQEIIWWSNRTSLHLTPSSSLSRTFSNTSSIPTAAVGDSSLSSSSVRLHLFQLLFSGAAKKCKKHPCSVCGSPLLSCPLCSIRQSMLGAAVITDANRAKEVTMKLVLMLSVRVRGQWGVLFFFCFSGKSYKEKKCLQVYKWLKILQKSNKRIQKRKSFSLVNIIIYLRRCGRVSS